MVKLYHFWPLPLCDPNKPTPSPMYSYYHSHPNQAIKRPARIHGNVIVWLKGPVNQTNWPGSLCPISTEKDISIKICARFFKNKLKFWSPPKPVKLLVDHLKIIIIILMLIWNLWTQLFITQLQELFIINLFNSVADTPESSVKEQNVSVTICVMLLNLSIIPQSTWSIPRFTIDLHCWWPNSMF